MTSSSSSTHSDASLRMRQMLAGGGAGVLTKTCIAPLERVKILFQVQAMKGGAKYSNNIGKAILLIVKDEGVLGLWKGNGANLVRVVPVYALKFSFNDTFKGMVRRPGQSVKELSTVQMMIAGSSAGLFQSLITYPLDLIRTRLTLSAALGSHYKGIVDCGVSTVRQEGPSALYKGITPTVLSAMPYVGLQMTFYELFKAWYPQRTDGSTNMFWKLAGGASAGLIAQTLTFPGDTIRRRMQSNGLGGAPREYLNTWDCITKILRHEGVVGMFRGVQVNALRCIPGAAIQFAAYDTLRSLLRADPSKG